MIRMIAALGLALSLQAQVINHVVVCWYNDTVDEATLKRAMEATGEFEKIPGILEVSSGKAVASERAIVDDSFSMAVHIRAASKEALDAYLVHPIHKRFVEAYVKGKTERVVVYDF
ncbi:MAG: Dabb family protein [Sulfurimonadaceae bacterium]|nr:Dabb family protein [Sulfurimonadaceae bacterium]